VSISIIVFYKTDLKENNIGAFKSFTVITALHLSDD